MRKSRPKIPPDNSLFAEWLCREAEQASYPLQRAFRAAGRAAFLWPEEVSAMVAQGRSLTALRGVGPFIEKQLRQWLDHPPPPDGRSELRQNFFTWTKAQRILANERGLKTGLRGDLQMHTEWSDGSGTVRAMAEAAMERGYEYIAITDHARRLKIAGGMTEAELEEQGREIARLNEELEGKNFRVLRSIELNLDPAGEGDLEPRALRKLDLVLGAFHSALRRTEDQTERYLAALNNPHVHILGHPRGRIYNYRIGLRADWARVCDVAAQLDKALEIDCYPDRQDLSLDLLTLARKAGARISLGTDSHHPWQLSFVDFGLAAAVVAKIPRERILNFMSRDRLLEWARALRSRSQRPSRIKRLS
jgi:histidinol phosphatase-like PHP family hydrolase